jgi:Tat protein translocase TatB subunit
MYLFILESIGTSELIMIGIVALIIFGPRKLPEMMRSFGRAMAEFRRSTNDFKQSWEKEVDLESIEKEFEAEKTIGRNAVTVETDMMVPEIKEIKGEDFDRLSSLKPEEILTTDKVEEPGVKVQNKVDLGSKQDWL